MQQAQNKYPKNSIKGLIDRIQNKDYIQGYEGNDFSDFGKFVKSNFHQVALMLGGFSGHSTDTQPVKMTLLLKALELPVLKQMVGQENKGFDMLCNHHCLYVKPSKNTRQISMHFSDVVTSFVFYSIAEGDFVKNIENLSETDLQTTPIAKIPNPYFNKGLKDQLNTLSVEDANLFFVAVYGFMAFVIRKCFRAPTKPVPPQSLFYIEPVVTKGNQMTYTNSQKLAKQNGYSLKCETVSASKLDELSRLFNMTHGYDGSDVDDWIYFSTGCRYGRYALSPSLGIKRKLNASEFYNL